MVLDLGDAHERRARGGPEPGHQIGDLGWPEGTMLGVDHHKIRTGKIEQVGHPTCAELQNHMSNRDPALTPHLCKAICFHSTPPLLARACNFARNPGRSMAS